MVSSFLDRFAPIDFTRYIDRLTDRFTGREWLFEQIDQWLQQQSQEQFYLLTGEPGVGKSAIVAQLIKRWQAQPENAEQGKLAAYHFCRAGDVETVRPGRVLRSIAAQLGNTLPHYGKALNKVLKDVHLNIDVNINIGNLTNSQVTGIYIENLKDLDPREELRLLIQAPLAELSAIYAKEGIDLPALKVFLIDSLDEAVTTTGRDNVATLLAALSQSSDLPPWIQFILTARPNSSALKGFESIQLYKLEEMFSKNLDDIEQYVGDRIQDLVAPPESEFQARLEQAELSIEKLVDTVKTSSEGNFLYTRLVMDGVSSGELSLKNLSALPKNLYEVYQRFLRHRCSVRKWINLYQPLLGTLTVTQEAISSVQLAKFAKVTSDQVEGVPQVESAIAILQQFLDEVEDEQGHKLYTIFHQSLREYLLDRKHNHDFWCDAKEQHDNIIECCEKESKDWQDLRAIDPYGSRQLAKHLVQASRIEELHTLLGLDMDGLNAWFDAKEQSGDIAGFMEDIRLAWNQADQEFEHNPKETLGLQFRYALITTSINSSAKTIPSDLLIALVEKKVWSPLKGLAYAKQNPEPWQRTAALRGLIRYLPEAEARSTLEIAIQAIQVIQVESTRANSIIAWIPVLPSDLLLGVLDDLRLLHSEGELSKVLIALIPHLSEESSLKEAFEITQFLKNDYHRGDTLSALVPYLPHDLLPQALRIAQTIQSESYQIKALTTLMPRLSEAVLVLLKAAKRMESDSYCCDALVAAIPYLPKTLLSDALETAQVIKGKSYQIKALTALIPYSSEAVLVLLKAAKQMESDSDRRDALMAAIPYLPENLLSEALETAKTIGNKSDQIAALIALIPRLPGILAELFQTAQEVESDSYRSALLIGLTPYLPENLLSKALEMARRTKDKPCRVATLMAFIPRLPQVLPDVLPEAYEVAQAIRDYSNRSHALQALAPYFPEGVPPTMNITEARQEIQTAESYRHALYHSETLLRLLPYMPDAVLPEVMASAQTLRDPSFRARVLTALVPRLPAALPEVLSTIPLIRDHGGSVPRTDAITAVIPFLSEDLLLEVLKPAQAIQDEDSLNEVLAVLFPYLPNDRLPEVLTIIQTIQSSDERANALIPLIPHLPDELLSEALQIAQVIPDEAYIATVMLQIASSQKIPVAGHEEELRASVLHVNEFYSAKILQRLVSYLPKTLLLQVLKVAQTIRSASSRAEVLTALLPRLPEAMPDLFDAIACVDESHLHRVLLTLIPALPTSLILESLRAASITDNEALFATVLQTAFLQLAETSPELLDVAQTIENEPYLSESLLNLASVLPEDLLPEVLKIIPSFQRENRISQILIALIPRLPTALLPETFAIATSLSSIDALVALIPRFPKALPAAFEAAQKIHNLSERAKALITLIPYLPEHWRLETLQAIQSLDDGNRTQVLAAFTPYMPEALPEAIRIVQSMQDEYQRTPTLTAIVPYLAQSPTHFYSFCIELLHRLHNQARVNVLTNIRLLSEPIANLGGTETVEQVFTAVRDVTRWWK